MVSFEGCFWFHLRASGSFRESRGSKDSDFKALGPKTILSLLSEALGTLEPEGVGSIRSIKVRQLGVVSCFKIVVWFRV